MKLTTKANSNSTANNRQAEMCDYEPLSTQMSRIFLQQGWVSHIAFTFNWLIELKFLAFILSFKQRKKNWHVVNHLSVVKNKIRQINLYATVIQKWREIFYKVYCMILFWDWKIFVCDYWQSISQYLLLQLSGHSSLLCLNCVKRKQETWISLRVKKQTPALAPWNTQEDWGKMAKGNGSISESAC